MTFLQIELLKARHYVKVNAAFSPSILQEFVLWRLQQGDVWTS